MSNLPMDTFQNLIAQGPRIKWLEKWLLEEVWTAERYQDLAPQAYLTDGESKVNELEEIIARAAYRLYDEFLEVSPQERNVLDFIESEEPNALVIFDGLSLRELPLLVNLVQRSNFTVKEVGASCSTLPTETVDFIDQKLKFGSIAPSHLPRRKDIKEKGIAAYYYYRATQQHILDRNAKILLLWSAFPDNTYTDSEARFVEHFEQMHTLLETAWLNTVQQIPSGRRILITSDHGYVYLGAGLSFARSNPELRPLVEYLGGERYRRLTDQSSPPPEHPDLAIYPSRKVAVLRGRIQTHPPGKSASKLYKHGGLSIMEILTPLACSGIGDMETSDIERLLRQPEGQFLERKSYFNYDNAQQKPRKAKGVAETLSAFANARGGTLLVGAEDDGTASGIDFPEDKFTLIKDAPRNLIKQRLKPNIISETIFKEKRLLIFYKTGRLTYGTL